ncbi:hypothetical protein E3P86_02874 [Wallemia ichthyophaga]|uniref:Uncharacterized protein n=1 Tax=Wallemia ichthyophaga TaxID=245174 RepID=A0A4T0J2T5_WALIC|nr:hypothetical protein E3P86_02874 [Wallemia ichthyophaga]
MLLHLPLIASCAAAILAAPTRRILDDKTDDGKGILFLNTREQREQHEQHDSQPDYSAQLLTNNKVSVLKRHDDDNGLVDVHILKRILGSNGGHDGEGDILGVDVLRRTEDLTDSSGTIDVDLLQRAILGIGGEGDSERDSTLGLFGRILNDSGNHNDEPLIGLLKRGAALGLGDTGDGAELLDVLRRGGLLSDHNDHNNAITLDVGRRGILLNDGSPDLAHVGVRSVDGSGLLTDDAHDHDDDNKLHIGVRANEQYSEESIGLRVIDKRSDDEVLGFDLEVRGEDDKSDLSRRVLGLIDGGHERDNGNLKVDNPVGLKRLAAGTCVLNGCDTGGGVIGL